MRGFNLFGFWRNRANSQYSAASLPLTRLIRNHPLLWMRIRLQNSPGLTEWRCVLFDAIDDRATSAVEPAFTDGVRPRPRLNQVRRGGNYHSIMSKRVSVVAGATPGALVSAQAVACSPNGVAEDMPSTGTTTLRPMKAAWLDV